MRERGVAVAVVGRALVRVHQHVVSLAELLELFLGMRIVRIFVGMILHRELAIRPFDLVRRHVPANFEHLVVIALGGGHYLKISENKYRRLLDFARF